MTRRRMDGRIVTVNRHRIAAGALVVAVSVGWAVQSRGPTGLDATQRPAPDPRSIGGGECALSPYNCKDAPNPLPPTDTVWLEEMTWMEVRDALAVGKTTVIIPTGGVEPNGPWLALGKHNYVLQANCDAIARNLGDALCAPIIKHVPEGDIDPPSGHMTSPGTISVRQSTFRALLIDTAESLAAHGFKKIFFIGDSGGNQATQLSVAAELSEKWGDATLIAHVPEYYDYAGVAQYMERFGVKPTRSDNVHDDPIFTLNTFAADPDAILYEARVRAGLATINGVDVSSWARNSEWAQRIVAYRAEKTMEAIRKIVAARPNLPTP
jgi:creatinine amidohydrolase